MSIQTELTRITNAKAAIKTAIEGKGVTVPAGTLLDGMASLIDSIPAGSTPSLQSKSVTYTANGTATITPDAGYDGLSSVGVTVNVSSGGGSGASAKWNDVTFIDYDGSVLHSYSLAEAQALTKLPTLPSHDGLVCQGWNWTLEAIKSLNRPVTVGAMYITDDGATRLHIRIATVGRMTVPLYIDQNVANGVSIDWGDGSTAETLSGTGNVNTSHTYAEPGDYVISLMPQGGCKLSFGSGSSSNCVMGSTGNNGRVYCNMLQEVYVGKNVKAIDNNAFQNCYSLANITIPSSVTSIGNYAFQNCYSLANITIPSSVTSIGSYTFSSCYSLASITIPTGVTSIGNYVFYSCFSLVNITIPTGVTSIGSNAFSYCYSLASITIPSSVTSIGSYAFSSCYSLASITIPTGVTSIGSYTFSSCYSLANITIPSSVTSIGNYAFQNCYSLANITIPSSVTSIGSYAFSSCDSLASITIPTGVTSIGSYTFSSCYSLANITIPNSVTSIGNNAFQNCYGMRYYDFSACTAIPTMSKTSAFSNIPSDCQMLIPSALYNSWKSATNWTTYANYMVSV